MVSFVNGILFADRLCINQFVTEIPYFHMILLVKRSCVSKKNEIAFIEYSVGI